MPQTLMHDLYVPGKRASQARQDFVASLRGFVLNDMANTMKSTYDSDVLPRITKSLGHAPQTGSDVHRAMTSNLYFKFYSSARYNAQEMVWRSVIHALNDNPENLDEKAATLAKGASALGGTLTLNPDLAIPENVSAVDVHLAPGAYAAEHRENDCAAGAIYDHGLNVFSFGMMGRNLDDIGQSIANYVRLKFSDFEPTDILDMGCTIGHNTLAWAQAFPEAKVTGIDVAAPCLRYAHARAGAQQTIAHFEQMDATDMTYEDNSFDVVFSSMFLHELSLKDIDLALKEARRILRPGGLLINMELPSNHDVDVYDGFYLDWDCYYNNEPFYKKFRDQNYTDLCISAGFKAENFVSFITPQYSYMNEDTYKSKIDADQAFDDNTGRLADGVQWFAFGAWKEKA